MHTVLLGIKDNTIRVPTAVCRFPPAFQRDNSFSGAGKIKAFSSGRNFLSVEQKGNKSGPTRAEPQRVLLEVFRRPKERDSSSSSHIKSACTEQVFKEVQVQNAHSFYTPKMSVPWRLVYVNRPEGRIFSHKDISTPQEIPVVCFPWRGIRIPGSTIRLVSHRCLVSQRVFVKFT